MPAKIRLQRRGKKGNPFYHIVIADGRAPRDGKYIERIGTYNPLTKPADIKLDIDKAVEWLNNGAQPTDTVRAILSFTGVLYKNHLLKGVKKGALTEEQAEAKFQTWLKEKEAKIESKIKAGETSSREEIKKRHEAETKINEARAAELAKKRAAELAAAQPAKPVEEVVEASEEVQAEVEEKTEVAEEVTEEPKAEEVKEEPKAEEVKEEPKAEEVKEEPKAEASEEPKAE